MVKVKEEDIEYSTDFAAPELLQVRSYCFLFIEFHFSNFQMALMKRAKLR